jgi:hypothetical protein
MGDDLDPFGRKKDENPLASLGWQDEPTTTGEPERAPEREPEPDPIVSFGTVDESQFQPATPPSLAEPDSSAAHWRSPQGHDHAQPTPPARGKPVGRLVRAVITLGIIVAVLGGLISVVVDEGVERADRFIDELAPPDVQAPSIPGVPDDAPTEAGRPERTPRGLSAGSLLRPFAFGRAINRLRTGGYGRLANLRAAPERIDATLVTKGGRLRQVQIVPGGAVRVIGTTPSGFAGTPTMALKGIVAAAPSRLTRSAAGRLRQPASRVNYLVLSEFAGARQWNVYFKGGQIFSADARGRITRRVG